MELGYGNEAVLNSISAFCKEKDFGKPKEKGCGEGFEVGRLGGL